MTPPADLHEVVVHVRGGDVLLVRAVEAHADQDTLRGNAGLYSAQGRGGVVDHIVPETG